MSKYTYSIWFILKTIKCPAFKVKGCLKISAYSYVLSLFTDSDHLFPCKAKFVRFYCIFMRSAEYHSSPHYLVSRYSLSFQKCYKDGYIRHFSDIFAPNTCPLPQASHFSHSFSFWDCSSQSYVIFLTTRKAHNVYIKFRGNRILQLIFISSKIYASNAYCLY
jgi:hypothetical protein